MDHNAVGRAPQQWLGLLVTALVAGVSFGLHYGMSNQNAYLVAGLQKIRPGLLSHDWLAQTYQIHHLFADIIPFLAQLGPLPWVLAILNVVLIAAALLAWHSVFQTLEPPHATACTLLLAVAFVAEGTFSVGGTYLFSSYLQPSSIAIFAMLLAAVCFLHGRYLASGLMLGFGGAFHANYLILGILVFGLAHLTLGGRGLIQRGLMQLVPSGLVFLKELPVFLTVARAPQSEASFYIFERIRAPHHLYPPSFLSDYLVYIGWLLLALAASGREPEEKRPPLIARMHGLQFALIGIVTLSTLLTTVVFIPRVSMLFLWRLAPFSVLLAQVQVIRSLVAKLTGTPVELAAPWPAWRRRVWTIGLLLPLVRLLFHRPVLTDLVLPLLMMVGTIGFTWFSHRRPAAIGPAPLGRTLPTAVSVAVLLPFLFLSLKTSTLLHGAGNPSERGLFSWARTTDSNAVFLIPPGLQNFRLQGERPVVVDWKSSPVLANELLEWYRRMGRVTGDTAVAGLPQAEQEYSRLTPSGLASLRQEFGADYAVFRTPHSLEGRIAYQNEGFVVLDLR
jgi:hypothetical protein